MASGNSLRTLDAIERAEGITSGLDTLVTMMMSASNNESITLQGLGEVLWSLSKDLSSTLKEARETLRRG